MDLVTFGRIEELGLKFTETYIKKHYPNTYQAFADSRYSLSDLPLFDGLENFLDVEHDFYFRLSRFENIKSERLRGYVVQVKLGDRVEELDYINSEDIRKVKKNYFSVLLNEFEYSITKSIF